MGWDGLLRFRGRDLFDFLGSAITGLKPRFILGLYAALKRRSPRWCRHFRVFSSQLIRVPQRLKPAFVWRLLSQR